MQITLIIKKGRTNTRAIELSHADTIIGRQRGCKVRIPSAEVSRRHCILSAQYGYVTVEDLDSANGTFLNGKRIMGKRVVRPNDCLEVGPLTFLVQYELTPAAQRALKEQLGVEPVPAAANEEELEVVDEELEVLDDLEVADEEEVLDAKVLEPAGADLEEPIPLVDDEMVEEEGEVVEELTVDLEEGAPWEMPDADQLRDLLKQMDRPKKGS
jgi:pSer/pThr/pTyr-binding forkhead associated (FHA) protein